MLVIVHDLYAVAATDLGFIESLVGKLECATRRAVHGRLDRGDPHADRDSRGGSRSAVIDIQVRYRSTDTGGRGARLGVIDIIEDGGEFLAPIACQDVERSGDNLLHGVRDTAQGLIAGLVSVVVV